MNKKEKYRLLEEMLSDEVEFTEIVRLVSGDLIPIGDALLDGKRILMRGKLVPTDKLRFNEYFMRYSIEQEIEEDEAVSILVEGRSYWMVSLSRKELCYKFDAKISNFASATHGLEHGLIYHTKNAAVKRAKELLELS